MNARAKKSVDKCNDLSMLTSPSVSKCCWNKNTFTANRVLKISRKKQEIQNTEIYKKNARLFCVGLSSGLGGIAGDFWGGGGGRGEGDGGKAIRWILRLEAQNDRRGGEDGGVRG